MSYEQVSKLVQQGGSVYFFLLFLAAVSYALWPGNRAVFRDAKYRPLDDGDADV